MECCVEFITLISSEANDISEKEAKKTIACEHVEKALRDLGFGDYIPDVLAVADEHKEQLKVCRSGLTSPDRVRLTFFDRTSPERRNRARWSRAVFRKKSFCDNNRSCSGLRRRSTMRRSRTVVPKTTLELMLVIEENYGRFCFCVYGRGGTGVIMLSYSLFRS